MHYHLFKNAGTSVDDVLTSNFGDRWVTREFPEMNINNTEAVEQWINETPEALAYSSHTMMGPIPKVEGVRITSLMLLRDPIERIKSAYRFERTQQVDTWETKLARDNDFEGYVRTRLARPHDRQCRNFQTYRLSCLVPESQSELDRARAALENLTVAGLVSDFSGALARLGAAIADAFPDFTWQNVHSNQSRKDDIVTTDDLDALLADANANDFALLAELQARLSVNSGSSS